jgi:hypothetical protein
VTAFDRIAFGDWQLKGMAAIRLVEIAASELLMSWPAAGHHRSGYSHLVDLVQNGVRTIAQALPFTAYGCWFCHHVSMRR